jgi:hypothetical protein
VVGHRLLGPNFSTTRAFHVVVIRDAQEMDVVALVTQNGGSGKSTLALGIADAAMGNEGLNRRCAVILNQTPPRGCRFSEAARSLNSRGVLTLAYGPLDHEPHAKQASC